MLGNALSADSGQILVYAGASIVSAATIGGALKTYRSRKTNTQKIDRMVIALVGEEPSDLNPRPAPGLVAKVEEYQKANVARKELGDVLINQFEQHKAVVTGLVAKVDTLTSQVAKVSSDVKVLVADAKPNGGATSRDAINRIEAGLGTNPENK